MNRLDAEQIRAIAAEGLAALAAPMASRPAWTQELVRVVADEAGELAETGAALLLASARDQGSMDRMPAGAARIVADAVAVASLRTGQRAGAGERIGGVA